MGNNQPKVVSDTASTNQGSDDRALPATLQRLIERLRSPDCDDRAINLFNNQIGDAGCIALAEALKVNTTVTKIDLSRNQIGDAGCIALAEALKVNTTVTRIELGKSFSKYTQELDLPPEFVDKSNEEIITFLRERAQGGEVEVRRVKALLLGPGEAGKTTLLHRFATGQFLDRDANMTDGIAITELQLSTYAAIAVPKESADEQATATFSGAEREVSSVTVRFWDCGGQEIYLNTHTLLFSSRSLYVAVCSWRSQAGGGADMASSLQQHLRTVQGLAAGAPIVLVTTRAEEVGPAPESALQQLRAQYPAICAYHHIDSRTGKGVEALRAELVQVALRQEHVKQRLPKSYLQLETQLQGLRDQGTFSIPQEQYLALVQKVGLDPAQHGGLLLSLHHDWGIVHQLPAAASLPSTIPHSTANATGAGDVRTATSTDIAISGSGLGGDVVLDPQQLADVLRCVITCSAQRPGQDSYRHGVLLHSAESLAAVWGQYEARLHPQFLQLLHSAGLAFPLFDSEGNPLHQSLVPSMLESHVDVMTAVLNTSGMGNNSCEAQLHRLFFSGMGAANQCPEAMVELQFDMLHVHLFPRLVAALQGLTSVGGTWRNCCLICSEHPAQQQQCGDVRSYLLLVEDSANKRLLLLPAGSGDFVACALVVRALLRLLEQHFPALSVGSISVSIRAGGVVVLNPKQIKSKLRKDNNSSYVISDSSHDDDSDSSDDDGDGDSNTAEEGKVFKLRPLLKLFPTVEEKWAQKDAAALYPPRPPCPNHIPTAATVSNTTTTTDPASVAPAAVRRQPLLRLQTALRDWQVDTDRRLDLEDLLRYGVAAHFTARLLSPDAPSLQSRCPLHCLWVAAENKASKMSSKNTGAGAGAGAGGVDRQQQYLCIVSPGPKPLVAWRVVPGSLILLTTSAAAAQQIEEDGKGPVSSALSNHGAHAEIDAELLLLLDSLDKLHVEFPYADGEGGEGDALPLSWCREWVDARALQGEMARRERQLCCDPDAMSLGGAAGSGGVTGAAAIWQARPTQQDRAMPTLADQLRLMQLQQEQLMIAVQSGTARLGVKIDARAGELSSQMDHRADAHDAKLDAVSSQLQQLRAEQQRLGDGISAVLSSNATLAAQVGALTASTAQASEQQADQLRLLVAQTQQLQSLPEELRKVHNEMHQILRETHRLPTLFVVLPLTPDAGILTRLKSGQVFKEKFVMLFLCSQSHIPVPCRTADGKSDFVFSLTREWVKKAAPVVAVGLVCLKLALTVATGMPVPIPTAGTLGVRQEQVDAALQLFSQYGSQEASEAVVEAAVDGLQQQLDQVAAGDSAAKEALVARVRGMEGSRAAYEAVRMMVEQHNINVGSQCGLRQVICEDKVAWVQDKDSVEQAWKDAVTGAATGATQSSSCSNP